MKIGIITFHRAHNYGAVLQCYALQQILTSFGHDVSVIDYRQRTIENRYKYARVFSIKELLVLPLNRKLRYVIDKVFKSARYYYLRNNYFQSFSKKHLKLTKPCITSIPDDFDTIIIGSDMMWADLCRDGNFDPIYLGKIPHSPKHHIVGYAVSGTPVSFTTLGNKNNFDFVKDFYSLSVREIKLADIVKSYTGVSPQVCLDPTLLTTSKTWDPIIDKSWSDRKYILTYYLRIPQKDRNVITKRLYNKYNKDGYEILDIGSNFTTPPTSVEDFISMIKYAKYIVTDSFHGVAFSIIFQTPIHAIRMNDPADERYVNILYNIGLDKLLVDKDFEPEIPDIDFSVSDRKLEEYKKSSIYFLQHNL